MTLTPFRALHCEVDRPVAGPPIIRACPKRGRWQTEQGRIVCGEHARALRQGERVRMLGD